MNFLFLLTSLALHLLMARMGLQVFAGPGIKTEEKFAPVFVSKGQFAGRASAHQGLTKALEKIIKGKDNTEGPSIRGANRPTKEEFVFREEEIVKNGNTLPKYPQQALEQGIQGTVLLKLTLNIDGEVLKSEVVQSSGSPLLDLAAFSASKSWKFKVELPVKRIIAPIKFVIES
jgi:TonB family protein